MFDCHLKQTFQMIRRFCIFFLIAFSNILHAQPSLISTKSTNVLYQWIENPVQIAIENYPCEKLVAKVDNGKLTDNGCNYIYKSESQIISKAKITIGVKMKKGIDWIDSFTLIIKPLEDPIPYFAMAKNGDTISSLRILANPYIYVPIEDWELHENLYRQKISSFSLKVVRNETIIFEESNFNPKDSFCIDSSGVLDTLGDTLFVDYTPRNISKNAVSFIRDKIQSGDYIIIENIKVVLFEKEVRKIKSLKYFILN